MGDLKYVNINKFSRGVTSIIWTYRFENHEFYEEAFKLKKMTLLLHSTLVFIEDPLDGMDYWQNNAKHFLHQMIFEYNLQTEKVISFVMIIVISFEDD